MDYVVKIEQLPIIKQNFLSVKDNVLERTERVKALAVTEENRKEVKQLRADLNKESKLYKIQLKNVKDAIMQPYTELESLFSECIGIPYEEADAALKEKIDSIEDGLKGEKAQIVQTYFEEYKNTVKNDFTNIKDIGLNITLSASLKSLKDTVRNYLDRVSADMQSLSSMENSSELIAEYKDNGCNLALAITTVDNRHKKIENEKAKIEKAVEQKKIENENLKQIADIVAPPKVVKPAEEISKPADKTEEREYLTCKFIAKHYDIEEFRALKRYLNERGFIYESVQ